MSETTLSNVPISGNAVANNIVNGVTIASDLAVTVAPIIAIYNPAAGAALATLAPVVSNFILTETQIILNLRSDMSTSDMIKALEASKSSTWNIKPLV